MRVGDAPIFNESFVFDQINESTSLQIKLVNQRGSTILQNELYLQDFLNYDEIDEDFWLYQDEYNPNKENLAKVCVKI